MMKKTLIGMMGVAVVFSSAMAQENENKEQKAVEVSELSYNELIEKQMEERSKAFNYDKVQKDDKALARFLEAQRNRILDWERQRSQTR